MELGLFFDLRNPARWQRPWVDLYARTLDIVAHAEELGAGSVWLTEHHLFDDGYLRSRSRSPLPSPHAPHASGSAPRSFWLRYVRQR